MSGAEMTGAAALRRIAGYASRYRAAVTGFGLLLLFESLVTLAPPHLTRMLIDDVLQPAIPAGQPAGGGSGPSLSRIVILIALAYATVHVLRVTIGWLSAFVGKMVASDLRRAALSAVLNARMWLVQEFGTGRILAGVVQDTAALEGFVVRTVQLFLVNLLRVIAIPLVMFLMDWKLALIGIAPVILLLSLSGLVTRYLRGIYDDLWEQRSTVTALAAEAVRSLRIVKAFAKEPDVDGKFADADRRFVYLGIKAERFVTVKSTLASVLTSVGVLSIWWMGGLAVLRGEATVGQLVAFTAYLAMFYRPAEALLRAPEWFAQNATIARRILKLIDLEPDLSSTRGMDFSGGIEFDGVTFDFEGAPVLQNASFSIAPGEVVGIVGPSGAGKTTVINLLLGFVPVQKGTVRLGGVDIREWGIRDLRAQTGVATQETILLDGTIRDNIDFGRGLSDAAIRETVARTGLRRLIEDRPKGLDTQVGESGIQLSAGEAQRVALARALAGQPALVILDEVTSNLDPETERDVVETLGRALYGTTAVIITHRPAPLALADRVLRIDGGRVVDLPPAERTVAEDQFRDRRMAQTSHTG